METKPFWQSQTVWASVVAFVGALAPVFGYTLAPDAGQEVITAVGATVTAVASVFAIIGRFKAGGLFIRQSNKPTA